MTTTRGLGGALSSQQYVALIGLTIVYLIVELAFNARLLDVVGGTPSLHEIERIEVWGRLLSGAAVALVALQVLWARRASSLTVLLVCAACVVAVYGGIRVLIDKIVLQQDARFRSASVNLVLLKQALATGKAELEGFVDDPAVFSAADGKAFLAMLPLLAQAMDDVDARTSRISTQILRAMVRRDMPEKRYAEQYNKAVYGAFTAYRDSYLKLSATKPPDVQAEFVKAWNDYVDRLAVRGWTPSTVPPRAERSVRDSVRQQIPTIPRGWALDDQRGFLRAIERQVEARTGASNYFNPDGTLNMPLRASGGRSIRIARGLSFEGFLAHSEIQQQLREELSLPKGVVIRTGYDADQFRRAVYEPFLENRVREIAAPYAAARADYEQGGRFYACGLDRSRIALVPSIALLFSLAGAVLHSGKLAFLLSSGAIRVLGLGRLAVPGGAVALLAVVAAVLAAILTTQTRITESSLYAQTIAPELSPVQRATSHFVLVGQALGYPLNDALRQHVLMGARFGYSGPSGAVVKQSATDSCR